jgi:hypothetical protein
MAAIRILAFWTYLPWAGSNMFDNVLYIISCCPRSYLIFDLGRLHREIGTCDFIVAV